MTVLLVKVETVTYNKFVRNGEAEIIRFNVCNSAFRFIKKGCDSDGRNVSLSEKVAEIGKGHSAVENIFNDEDVFSGKIVVKVFKNFYNTGRFGAAAIAGNGHEVDVERNGNCSHKVGHENYGTFENGNKHKIFSVIIFAYLFAHFFNCFFNVLFGNKDSFDVFFDSMHFNASLSSEIIFIFCGF